MTLTMLMVAVVSFHSVTLSWINHDVYDNVLVYRATQSGGPYSLYATISGTSMSYVDDNVTGGHSYYYEVSGIRNGQESSKSNEVLAYVPRKTRMGRGDQ